MSKKPTDWEYPFFEGRFIALICITILLVATTFEEEVNQINYGSILFD